MKPVISWICPGPIWPPLEFSGRGEDVPLTGQGVGEIQKLGGGGVGVRRKMYTTSIKDGGCDSFL